MWGVRGEGGPAAHGFRQTAFRSHRRTDMSTQPLLQRTAGKRIALPVRVEPKVFFANERTCTWWMPVGVGLFADRTSPVLAQLHCDALGPGRRSAQLW